MNKLSLPVVRRALAFALALAPAWCAAQDLKPPQAPIRFKVRQKDFEPGPRTTPDGKVGLRADGLNARLYDVRTNKAFGPTLQHVRRRDDTRITTWAFSPDGKMVATGAGDPGGHAAGDSAGEVRVWDVARGKLLASVSDSRANIGFVHALAFTPDGKTVLVECDEVSGK